MGRRAGGAGGARFLTADADAADAGAGDADAADADAADAAAADEEQATFDPDDTIALTEVAAFPMGSDTPEFPFGDLPEGIEFDIPAAHTVSIWEEPQNGEWVVVGRNQAGFVQVNLPGADIDDVIAYIEAETAEKGWEPTDDEALYTQVVPLPDGAVDSDADGEWFADTELRFIANETPTSFLNVRITIRPFVR